MDVQTVSNILGYRYDTLVKEFRTTYNYEKGNDVTVVERRSYRVTLYDSSGNVTEYPTKGGQIDNKA